MDINGIEPTIIKLARIAKENDTTIEELCEEILEQKASTPKRKAYNIDEVATILGVTRRTIYSYISSGGLKAFKVGNRWRVSDIAIDSLFRTGMKPGPKEKTPKQKEVQKKEVEEALLNNGLDNSFLSEEYEHAIRRR